MTNPSAVGRDVLLAVATGVLFGAVLSGALLLTGDAVKPAVFAGVVGALLIGVMTFRSAGATSAQAVVAREALGFDLTPAVRRDALRGQPSVDPQERQRQLAVVHYVLGRVRSTSARNTIIAVVLAALQIFQAMTTSGWFWLGAAFFVLLALGSQWEIARLRRRRTLLASTL